jgi:hypothetical protein
MRQQGTHGRGQNTLKWDSAALEIDQSGFSSPAITNK